MKQPRVFWLCEDDSVFHTDHYARKTTGHTVPCVKLEDLVECAEERATGFIKSDGGVNKSMRNSLAEFVRRHTEPEGCLLRQGDKFRERYSPYGGTIWLVTDSGYAVVTPDSPFGTPGKTAHAGQFAINNGPYDRINPDGTTTPVRGWADE